MKTTGKQLKRIWGLLKRAWHGLTSTWRSHNVLFVTQSSKATFSGPRMSGVVLFALCLSISGIPLAWGGGAKPMALDAEKRAGELAKEGTELRRAGKDAEAVGKFKQAYELFAAPKNAAQYGLCLLALSRWTDADFYLTEAVAAKDDAWVKKNRSVLKDASESAKSHIGRVEILGSPEGANVRVSGRIVGTLPLAADIPVNEGSVDIEVSADGYSDGTRTIAVAGASHQSVVIRLMPAASKSPLAMAPLPTADSETHAAVADEPERSRSAFRSPWLWVGVGVVVAAIGVSLLVMSGGTSYPQPDQKGGWQQ